MDALKQPLSGMRLRAAIAAMAVVYFLAAKLSFLMAYLPVAPTPVWIPSGVSLAMILLLGPKISIGVALGAALLNLSVTPASIPTIMGLTLADTLEPLCGVYVIRRFGKFQNRISQLSDVMSLVAGSILGPAVGALIGTTTLCMTRNLPWTQYGDSWLTWWVAALLSDLVMAPLLLAWLKKEVGPVERHPGRFLEIASVSVLATAVVLFVFFSTPRGGGIRFAYWTYLFLIWFGIRFGLRATVLGMFLLSVLAIWSTAIGRGPFLGEAAHENLLFVQAFLAISSVAGMILVTITKERESALSELRISEELFRSTFESGPNPVILVDSAGTISLVNARTEHLLGFRKDELIGKEVEFLVPERFRTRHYGYRREYFSHPDTRAMGQGRSLAVLRKDGTEIPVEIGLNPLWLDHQIYILTTVVDITARKIFEEERNQLIAQLKKAIELRDEFLSIASHELKTPLTSLGMHIQLINRLSEQGTLAKLSQEKLKDLLRISGRQLDRFSVLINDLLDVSRISAGRLTLKTESVDLVELVKEVVARFQMELLESGCVVELRGDPSVVGQWDRLRVDQIIVNLLTNAMKFGAGKPIEIEATLQGKMVRLSVTDHGVGIRKEDQARIFERFERAASTRSFSGLGLGLYIVREIIKAYGGSIRVESDPGRATTFTVEIPVPATSGVS